MQQSSPSVPTNVQASNNLANNIHVSWDAATARPPPLWVSTTNDSSTAAMYDCNFTNTYYDYTVAVPGTTYYFWVVAANDAGTSDLTHPKHRGSGPGSDRHPAAPTNVQASNDQTDQVTVTWDASATATSYQLWVSTTNDSTTSTMYDCNFTNTYYDYTAAAPGVTYYFWVVAANDAGTGDFSNPGEAGSLAQQATPAAPTNVQASNDQTDQVTVTWDAAANATSYQVWSSTTDDSTTANQLATGVTNTTYADTTATPGTTCYYWVVAANDAGNSDFSSPSAAGVAQAATVAPAAATNLQASNNLTDDIHVTWDAATGTSTYQLWVSTTNDSSTATMYDCNFSNTYYDYTAAAPGVTYYFWVVAANDAGTSDLSDPSTAGSLAQQAAPAATHKRPGQQRSDRPGYHHLGHRGQCHVLPGLVQHDRRLHHGQPTRHRRDEHDLHRHHPHARHDLLLLGRGRQQHGKQRLQQPKCRWSGPGGGRRARGPDQCPGQQRSNQPSHRHLGRLGGCRVLPGLVQHDR